MRLSILIAIQLVLTALILGAFALTRAATSASVAAPAYEWDARLTGLGVTLEPASDCSTGCWRLHSARYEDEREAQGLHHIWARALDENGTTQENIPWYVGWPGSGQSGLTKPPAEWADMAMWNCFPLNEGGRGAYYAYMGGNPVRSDTVRGMGLPYCIHVNFRLVWQWVGAGAPVPSATPSLPARVFGHSLDLPLMLAQESDGPPPSPTATLPPAPTPTVTATPLPGSPWSGAVLQTFENCGLTQIFGVVHDANGSPLPNTQVRLTWDAADAQTYTTVSGTYIRPETDSSGWEFFLNSYPVANTWRVAVVDAAGNSVSADVRVQTDGHCDPGAHNIVKLLFTRNP